VGNTSCENCHQQEFQQWLGSDHEKSMQVVSANSVLGNFANITVSFHDIESRLYTSDNQYFIDTLDEAGQPATYQVKYTFGHDPLQQYLVELNNGHFQALNIAWDSRPANQGGQRWIHLQPDEQITPQHPFYWANHFQNWNSRCADCHSTNLNRNYNATDSSYATQWSEINVSCEACHGPASEHVEMAQNGSLAAPISGFEIDISDRNRFVFSGNSPIASNTGNQSTEQLNSCAVCHSRRGVAGDYEANKDYHEQFQLSLLNQNLYFADGQINDEVFVYGSFVQSKMYQAGVTCTDCHNPHTAQLKAPGNSLCQSCHQTETYQTRNHHRHVPNSVGAQCVSCHMPERTYMQVDDRADHSFSIPRPALANKVGAPNACAKCHDDWAATDLVANYVNLFGEEPVSAWAEANFEANRLNILALPGILAIADDAGVPAIRRASLLAQAANYPTRISLESIQRNLLDADPLVRRAAVEGVAFLPPQGRLQILQALITDEVKSVRLAVANQLADAFGDAPANMRPALLLLYDEYVQSLQIIQDTPGGQINLASFFYRRGNPIATERAYQRALAIEPAFVPAMLNLADLRREEGNEAAAEDFLLRALEIAPDSGAVHHSLGLLYVRRSQLDLALQQLQLATTQADAAPRYSYVYAVALESTGAKDDAIQILKESEVTWPNQVETLLLLVNYLDQEGRAAELLPYLSNLSRIMPGNPAVTVLVNKYSQNRAR
jgi:predicted CXXCH cytochrome family protein|tara:strand:+ start:29113 stop:31284 length:2172 start_codon:yes stop_codon:yes gene_type:complete